MSRAISPARRYVSPQQGDTLRTLAAREFPELPGGEAAERLRAWNPHLGFALGRGDPTLLVSQVVYVEPPHN